LLCFIAPMKLLAGGNFSASILTAGYIDITTPSPLKSVCNFRIIPEIVQSVCTRHILHFANAKANTILKLFTRYCGYFYLFIFLSPPSQSEAIEAYS